jgi:hypothetical protein
MVISSPDSTVATPRISFANVTSGAIATKTAATEAIVIKPNVRRFCGIRLFLRRWHEYSQVFFCGDYTAFVYFSLILTRSFGLSAPCF